MSRIKEPKELAPAVSYYVLQKGKRIRPLFLIATTEALGGDLEDSITVGCVVEMIHNYSLIHDDLPAMDNDDYRRGLPSCHKKFGEAIAILAGDALLTYAFEIMSDISLYKSLKAEDLLKISKVLALKSGAEGIVGGQALDICGSGDLERVNLKKTASLFEACFMCAGIISRREDILSDLEGVGRLVGLLFQITDDILDRNGYWSVLGTEKALEKARALYRELLHKLKNTFENTESLVYLTNLVYRRIKEDT